MDDGVEDAVFVAEAPVVPDLAVVVVVMTGTESSTPRASPSGQIETQYHVPIASPVQSFLIVGFME